MLPAGRPHPIMEAEAHLKAGQVDEALTALQQEVRSRPGDASLRTFLFELLSVVGQWERALQQLSVLADMDATHLLFARIYQPVIQSEVLRLDIFAGRRTPLILGEPEAWMSLLLEANQVLGKGQSGAAQELREQALADAPATPGQIDGADFAWLADADQRLGPLLEVILEGGYYWAPLSRIRRIEISAPKHLRDLIWVGVKFTWANGGEANGLIPTRYPGTESAADPLLRLGKRTEWTEQPGGLSTGLGQRLLASDVADYPLLEVRTVDLTPAAG